jgi:hypothetical protein
MAEQVSLQNCKWPDSDDCISFECRRSTNNLFVKRVKLKNMQVA